MRRLLALLLALAPATASADFADHWAALDDVGPRKSPRRGHSRVAILPLVLDDSATDPELAAMRQLFEGTGPGTFSAYWHDQSLGTLDVEAVVLEPVHYPTCPLPADRFPGCEVARGDLAAAGDALALLGDALLQADAAGLDATEFDLNGARGVPDGIIDGLVVITNMPYGGIAAPIFDLNHRDNLAGGEGGSFFVDGIEIPTVAVGGDRFVAFHEFGHVLGLTDLYNEDGTAHGLKWSLMGDWYYDERIPQLDAPSRVALGWARVHTVSGTEELTLRPSDEGGEVVKLGSGTEFFLVENRGPGAVWDRGMTARGLAVYHVDWAKGPDGREGGYAVRLLHCVECDPWHPFLMNLQADGRFDLQRTGTRQSDADDLFGPGDELGEDPSGLPLGPDHAVLSSSYYDGSASGISLGSIELDEATGVIRFTATAPAGTDGCAGVSCPFAEHCVDGGCVLVAQGAGPAAGDGSGGGTGSDSSCSQAGAGLDLVALALVAAALAKARRSKSAA